MNFNSIINSYFDYSDYYELTLGDREAGSDYFHIMITSYIVPTLITGVNENGVFYPYMLNEGFDGLCDRYKIYSNDIQMGSFSDIISAHLRAVRDSGYILGDLSPKEDNLTFLYPTVIDLFLD